MTVIAVQTDLSEFRFGTQSLQVTTGDTGDNALYPTADSIVVPGLPYTLSCYVKTAAPITGGSLYLQIAAGGTITPALFQSEAVTDSSTYDDIVNGWHRMSVSFVAPEGVQLVRPVIKYTGSTLGLVFWLDGIKFEPGLVASTWQQNIVSKQLVLDQGAVQVDASEGGLLRLRGSAGGSRDTIALGDNGFLLGGDTPLYSPAANVLRTDSAIRLNVDATIRRSAADTLIFEEETGATLKALDFMGALLRGFSGTSFPASPTTDDAFYRTDYDLWFRWNGTRWLSDQLFHWQLDGGRLAATNADAAGASCEWHAGASDIWIEDVVWTFYVASGGTALSGSHKWDLALKKNVIGASTVTDIDTLAINSGASQQGRTSTATIDALLNNGTQHVRLNLGVTKTGTPGDLICSVLVPYRIVAV